MGALLYYAFHIKDSGEDGAQSQKKKKKVHQSSIRDQDCSGPGMRGVPRNGVVIEINRKFILQ